MRGREGRREGGGGEIKEKGEKGDEKGRRGEEQEREREREGRSTERELITPTTSERSNDKVLHLLLPPSVVLWSK